MVEKKLDKQTPKGLEIEGEEGEENITITLGDDVNLEQIVDYLVDKKHITQIEQDENGDCVYRSVKKATITIKMCGKDQNDTYSFKMSPYGDGELFQYRKKYKYILCDGDGIKTSDIFYRFKCRNNYITCKTIDNQNLLIKSRYGLVKDIKGNLSWCKTTKDGKVYMCNAKDQNIDPDRIDKNKWKPIRYRFWSNIYHWYLNNFDDFDDNIKKQTSKIKRFGRLFIGQESMTGDWLCGKGCCGLTPSGYNEYDFYKEKPNNNTESGNNISNDLPKIIINN